ncbi:MAG: TetR/AcrR family transcriptional regulator [Myxococcales bacterium]|nr:TetR/AcrR family transcriptional regulator [Myxococcales bacterium]
MHSAEKPISADGRLQRSERSREAIVQALYELVGEGILEPTAEQVAERAGVGIRTVFRHFSDMESLFSEMDARIQAEARPLLEGDSRDHAASPVDRVRQLAQLRARLFEKIAPYKRAGNLKRARSTYLQSRHMLLVRSLREDLLRCLPELQNAAPELRDALELVASFETWDRLRSEQKLSRSRATAALEHLLTVLAKPL